MPHPHLLLAAQAAQVIGHDSSEIARLGQIIVPCRPANGKGHRALYDFRNLIEMHIVLVMSDFGVPQKMIRHFLQSLRNSLFGWIDEHGKSGWIAMSADGRWGAGDTLDEAAQIIGAKPAVIAIDLTPIREKIKANLDELTFVHE